jgi:hypothetical protein
LADIVLVSRRTYTETERLMAQAAISGVAVQSGSLRDKLTTMAASLADNHQLVPTMLDVTGV